MSRDNDITLLNTPHSTPGGSISERAMVVSQHSVIVLPQSSVSRIAIYLGTYLYQNYNMEDWKILSDLM